MFLDSNGPFLNVLEEQDITLILVDVFFFCYFFFFGGGGVGGMNGIYLNVIKEQNITWILVDVFQRYERYLFERHKRAGHNMDSS